MQKLLYALRHFRLPIDESIGVVILQNDFLMQSIVCNVPEARRHFEHFDTRRLDRCHECLCVSHARRAMAPEGKVLIRTLPMTEHFTCTCDGGG